MISLISIFSLFILILTQNSLTLPIADEQSLTTTFSSLDDDLTTQFGMNLQSESNDQTTSSLTIEAKRLSDDKDLGSDETTSISGLEENASRASRTFDEYSTIESSTETAEKSLDRQHDQNNLLLTTNEPITPVAQYAPRNIGFNSDNEFQPSRTEVELTTDLMRSRLSAAGDEFRTSKSSTLKSTEKYNDDRYNSEENDKSDEKDKKSKSDYKTTKNSKIDSEENFPQSPTRATLSFQKVIKKIPDIPNDLMTLVDDDDEMIVTIPNRFLTPSTNGNYEGKPLNQGEKSSYNKEKKSNN